MKRINDRTVEFTTQGEVLAHEQFDTLLSEGKGIAHAALLATSRRRVGQLTRWTTPFSAEFLEYLSDETLTVDTTRSVRTTGPLAGETEAWLAEQHIRIEAA